MNLQRMDPPLAADIRGRVGNIPVIDAHLPSSAIP
jgi:hypothetical protein